MSDWLYILKSTDTTMNGKLATPGEVLDCARAQPRGDWWLSRRRHMVGGDRIWIYFTSPYKVIAAMADVEDEPQEVADPAYPWRFTAVLHLAATRALHDRPVPLSALSNRHPQGVVRAPEPDLTTLMAHAGL
ncbi:hypothetical protein [Actinacidiphila glaucinigra]|uniref:hypothetical protein n=1 Tax=Actinacidiphila glaucinigra TaxID=235986 RepID=UPI0035DEB42A